MLAKRHEMENRKQSVSGRARKCVVKILRSLAPLLLIASLLILYSRPSTKSEANKAPASNAVFDEALAPVLTQQTGDSRMDKEISRLQQQIRNGRNLQLGLEQ